MDQGGLRKKRAGGGSLEKTGEMKAPKAESSERVRALRVGVRLPGPSERAGQERGRVVG